MSDTNAHDSRSLPNTDEGRPGLSVGSETLPSLVERLRALQSAWRVLAGSCLSERGREVTAAGRALQEELSALRQQPDRPDEVALRRANAGLDRLARSICSLAYELPIPQLRATLPGCLGSDRRGLLDLLELLAVDAFEAAETFGQKLAVIDYLITLLCTDGDGRGRVAPHDPVLLTPGFQALCQRAAASCDAPLPEIEAEFFSAANVESDLRDELQLRGLRLRKTKLGRCYFAPSMLRAIVTYNLALLQCAAAEAWDAQDWGGDTEADPGSSGASVFEVDVLQALHESVRSRIQCGDPETGPVGRIAWALDLGYVSASERAMLLEGRVPSPEHLRGTIILVGLLCRSLTVLSVELQAIGISPDVVSDCWVKELDELLKGEVNQCLGGDAYQQACVLSELRNKFLFAPILAVHRENRGAARPRATGAGNATEERTVRKAAKELASEALSQKGPTRAPRPDKATGWREWPWRLIAPAGLTAVAAVLVGLHFMGVGLLNGELDRFSGKELESVSPYLVRGHRNGDGAGPAFVGKIGEEWLALGKDDRRSAAEQLVDALRRQGVTQVMIYDDEERLRIQALGKRVRMP